MNLMITCVPIVILNMLCKKGDHKMTDIFKNNKDMLNQLITEIEVNRADIEETDMLGQLDNQQLKYLFQKCIKQEFKALDKMTKRELTYFRISQALHKEITYREHNNKWNILDKSLFGR